jgi:hypothetical protein
MLAFLEAMQEADELRALTFWKVQTLTAKAHGAVDDNREISGLNLEDYH